MSNGNDAIDWVWRSADTLCLEGKGWKETSRPYDRLPAKAQGVVREEIWNLSRFTTGLSVRFRTNAVQIKARWILGHPNQVLDHTPRRAHSGLDLYARSPAGAWRWVGFSDIIARDDGPKESVLNRRGPLDGESHEFRLYLPLYNSVERLEIGIPRGAVIETAPARTERPIVYYGTSIVHGAGVSRPGMTFVAVLERKLDYPLVSLGFSGQAIMEAEVADLLAELDPALYVLDAIPNMTAERINDHAEPFIRRIRSAHPDTPIVLVEDRTYPAAWITPGAERDNSSRREAFKAVYGKLLSDNVSGLHYLEGDGLLGTDNDGTTDGSHTSDLGSLRMAEALEPVLRRLLFGFDAR